MSGTRVARADVPLVFHGGIRNRGKCRANENFRVSLRAVIPGSKWGEQGGEEEDTEREKEQGTKRQGDIPRVEEAITVVNRDHRRRAAKRCEENPIVADQAQQVMVPRRR